MHSKLLSLLICLLLGLLPLVVNPGWEDSVVSPKLVFTSLTLALICLGLVFQGRGLSWSRFRSPLGCLVCLQMWGLLTFLIFGNSDGGLKAYQWLAGTAFALVLWQVGDRHRDWVERAVVLGWTASAAYGLMQRADLDVFQWSNPELSKLRMIAGFGNPNYFALHLAFLAPIVFDWGVVRSTRPWRAAIGLLLWTTGCFTIWLSGTRASMLSLLVGLLVQSILWWRRLGPQARVRYLVGGWGGLVVVIGLSLALDSQRGTPMSVENRVFSIASTGHESNRARLLLWKVAAQEGLSRPWGWGVDWFGYRYQQYRDQEPWSVRLVVRRPEHPHNYSLELLFDLGVPGLLLWLAALVKAVQADLKSDRSGAYSACLVSLILNSCFISVSWSSFLTLVWILDSTERQNQEKQDQEKQDQEKQDQEKQHMAVVGLGWFSAAVLFGWVGYSLASYEKALWSAEDQWYAARQRSQSLSVGQLKGALAQYGEAESTAPPWKVKDVGQRQLELCIYQLRVGVLPPPAVDICLRLAQSRSQKYSYDAYVHLTVARLVEGIGDAKFAELGTSAYQRAIGLEPYSPYIRLDYARWNWRIGRYSEALEVCTEVLRQVPEWESAQIFLALVLHSLGRSQEAEQQWQRVLQQHRGPELTRPW